MTQSTLTKTLTPVFKYVISMSWKDQCIKETMANVYNPSGKLCGSITMHRLRILYSAFRNSQLHQPDTHKLGLFNSHCTLTEQIHQQRK